MGAAIPGDCELGAESARWRTGRKGERRGAVAVACVGRGAAGPHGGAGGTGVATSDAGDDQSFGSAAGAAPCGADVQKKALRASEQRREEVIARRAAYQEIVATIDANKLIFIDESGCNLSMTPRCAWSLAGVRAEAFRPMNWGKNVTMIGAVRTTGLVTLRSMEGAMKTMDFLQFVARDLVPKLKLDDVVVLDNLRQHHDPRVRLMIENAGAKVLYLPPYSPDLSPIEPYWSAFKAYLRRFEARTKEALFDAIHAVRKQRIPTRNFFTHCGYP